MNPKKVDCICLTTIIEHMSGDGGIFSHLNILIIHSNEHIAEIISLKTTLLNNSADSINELNVLNINHDNLKELILGQNISFIVSYFTDSKFVDAFTSGLLIPVVTPNWVHDSITKQRLLKPYSYSPCTLHILKHTKIYISEELWSKKGRDGPMIYDFFSQIIIILGGEVIDNVTLATTHVLCDRPTDPSLKVLSIYSKEKQQRPPKAKPVHPLWLIKTFLQLRPQNESKFIISIYDIITDIQDTFREQWLKILKDVQKNIFIQNNNHIKYNLNNKLFESIFFIIDDSIGSDTKYGIFIKSWIEMYGGTIISFDDIEYFPNNNIYFLSYEEGSIEYEKAIEKKFKVINVCWLFNCWSLSQILDPNCSIFFKPWKTEKALNSLLTLNKISITNFYGSQRFYLKQLIQRLDGIVTSNLSNENNYLITSMFLGKKIRIAKESFPDCKIVTTQWLKDTYFTSTIWPLKDDLDFIYTSMPNLPTFLEDLNKMIPNASLLFHEYEINRNKIENTTITTTISNISQSSPMKYAITQTPMKMVDEDDNDIIDLTKQTSLLEIPTNLDSFIFGYDEEEEVDEALDKITSNEIFNENQVDERQSDGAVSSKDDIIVNDEGDEPTIPTIFENNQEEEAPLPKTFGKNHAKISILDEIANPDMEISDFEFNDSDAPTISEGNNDIASDVDNNYIEHSVIQDNNDEVKDPVTKNITTKINEDKNLPDLNQNENIDNQYTTDLITNYTTNNNDNNEDNDNKLANTEANNERRMEQIPSAEVDINNIEFLPSRSAKNKAVKRLHQDIELLNEFQKNIKKKKTGSLFPSELEKLQKEKDLKQRARGILWVVLNDELRQALCNPNGNVQTSKCPYNMDGLCSGSHKTYTELDLAILQLLGIRIHEQPIQRIKMNAIFSNKIVRTQKFMESLSWRPLKYALTFKFLDDLLKRVYDGKPNTNIQLITSGYIIPGITPRLLARTQLKTKVFERLNMLKVNIAYGLPGGSDTISSILKSHGVDKVRTFTNKMGINDALNNNEESDTSSPIYIFVCPKNNKLYTKIRRHLGKLGSGLIVDWDWIVQCILSLATAFPSGQRGLLYHPESK